VNPSFEIDRKPLAVKGRLLRTCFLRDEYYDFLDNPSAFIVDLKRGAQVKADLFTFIQEIPNPAPMFDFHLEWDTAAVLSLVSYENWWKKQINDKTRNMVRKAAKSRVEIRIAEFNDDLLKGIEVIYNESPVRQGRRFRHYKKNLDTLRSEHGTFLDRSQFLGAYYDGQLIGFAKLVYGRGIAQLMNIISMISHRNKAPTNGLIAKAVEICTSVGIPYLQFGTGYSGSIGEFKKHHAFEEFRVPRYYIPVNHIGVAALKLRLHRGIDQRLPAKWRDQIRDARAKWNTFRFRKSILMGQ
jgi:hypothetical protein